MHITLQTRMLLAKAERLRETHRALLGDLLTTHQQVRSSRIEVLCSRDRLRKNTQREKTSAPGAQFLK